MLLDETVSPSRAFQRLITRCEKEIFSDKVVKVILFHLMQQEQSGIGCTVGYLLTDICNKNSVFFSKFRLLQWVATVCSQSRLEESELNVLTDDCRILSQETNLFQCWLVKELSWFLLGAQVIMAVVGINYSKNILTTTTFPLLISY